MLVGGHAVGDPVDLGQQDRQFLVDGGAARRWQATDGDIPIGQCIGIEVGQLGKLPLLIDLELGQADPRDTPRIQAATPRMDQRRVRCTATLPR